MPITEHFIPVADGTRVRAAQYVRMSTENQQYSTQNQADKILEYASSRNIDIVRTYADEGKSGLTFNGRFALRQLVNDVESRNCDFEAILVYDVSRWGRYQDSDEAAHYEFICKRAGVKIIYCAEQFENDGTPVAAIVKGVKRAMAGEYSRELSVKVFAGQCRFVRMGYRQGGGSKIFGYRSLLVDSDGTVKSELLPGERKCIQTQHVVLALGKDAEAEVVQRIFELFVGAGLTEGQIAQRLNVEGVSNRGRKWNWNTINYMLKNEVYIGSNVFNKRSAKLGSARQLNAEEKWVRMDNAHPPLVSLPTFMAAQQILAAKRVRHRSDDALLQSLRDLLAKHGRLTTQIIDREPGGTSASTYVPRFGSLVETIVTSPQFLNKRTPVQLQSRKGE